MATPSSSGADQTPRLHPPWHPPEHINSHYRRYIDNNKIPEISGGWNWEPFIRSLVEEELKYPQNDVFNGPRRDSDSSSDGDSAAGVDAGSPSFGGPGPAPPQDLPHGNAGEGYPAYLLYVPAWSEPSFVSDLRPVYGPLPQKYELLPPWNLFQRLRPALRPDDAAQDPTPYAMRWGICPDRSDGRSRLSPSHSNTRQYNTGINEGLLRTLDDTTRNLLLQETQARIQSGTTTYRGEGVAPEVLDEARRHSNVPGQEELVQRAINSGRPFSRLALPAGFDAEPYRDMIQEMMMDEDYQRLLFDDLTTDELVRHGIHNLSDDEQFSLTPEPLHELVSKERWEDTAYKGDFKEWPRLVYQLGGPRKDYDVHQNAELWTAMQPALQFVSKVLSSQLPFWAALKDLRTRTAIPQENDPRPEADRRTHRLVRVRLLDEALQAGAVQNWPILYQLAEQGLDYESAVDYILREKLRLEIVSGHMSNGKFRDSFRYGVTTGNPDGENSVIRVCLSAELLWPLLVPNYSSSEKLATSFFIAATLLHELMHATQLALDILCVENAGLWIPNVTAGIAFELKRWHDANQDPDTALGEPWFGTDVQSELGWALENDLFGMVISTLASSFSFMPRHVQLLPIILGAQTYPSDAYNTGRNNTLKNVFWCRPEVSQEPVPIYFFAKFFTQAFWDQALPTFGFEAFRRRATDRTLLRVLHRGRLEPQAVEKVCGGENRRFFMFVITTLRRFGYGLLAHWLRQTLVAAVAHANTAKQWEEDLMSWEHSRQRWADAAADMLYDKETGDAVLSKACNLTLDAYHEWASGWKYEYPCPAYGDWVRLTRAAVSEHFQTGGPFFTSVSRLHGLAQAAIPEMERIVFEFLALTWHERFYHYSAASAPCDPLVMLQLRIDYYAGPLREAATTLDGLFQAGGAELCRLWSARCREVLKVLDHLKWLLQSHEQRSDDENRQARETLKSVPSAYWESPQKRLREIGMREYQLLTPPIRVVIDEFDRRLRAVEEHQQTEEGQRQRFEMLWQQYQTMREQYRRLAEQA